MQILITGGAGFIGSHLCDALWKEGHRLTVIDNLILGKKENIAHLEGRENFSFVEEDVLNLPALRGLFEKGHFDMVYHLAANSDIRKGGNDPRVDYELTFQTTFHVLECMRIYDVRRLFFASTSAVYGEAPDLLAENYGPLQPVSNYGAAKLASEAFISAFSSAYGIQTWIARFPNVVGERLTHGVIYDFIQRLQADSSELTVLGNGEQNKPYLYVKDLIEGILCMIRQAHERLNVYNLGSMSRTKVKEIASLVIEEMGAPARIVYTGGDRGWVGDVPEFLYDLSKIHQLGWQAAHDSNTSVRLSVRKMLGK